MNRQNKNFPPRLVLRLHAVGSMANNCRRKKYPLKLFSQFYWRPTIILIHGGGNIVFLYIDANSLCAQRVMLFIALFYFLESLKLVAKNFLCSGQIIAAISHLIKTGNLPCIACNIQVEQTWMTATRHCF